MVCDGGSNYEALKVAYFCGSNYDSLKVAKYLEKIFTKKRETETQIWVDHFWTRQPREMTQIVWRAVWFSATRIFRYGRPDQLAPVNHGRWLK